MFSEMENIMKSAIWIGLLLFLSVLLFPTWVSADLMKYAHAGKGYTLSASRGFALRNDELEHALTEEFTLGIELKPNVLQLRIPFGTYEVDTRGKGKLPPGTIRAKSIGVAFWLGFGGERWTPFIGAGGAFYSFQDMLMTGNLENDFGAELYAGIRFRLAENLWDYLKVRGALHYQATFLRPGVQLPDYPDTDRISMHRHSVVLMLEIVGL